jgi:hypothetical protein
MYTVKGLGTEHTIDSKMEIFTECGKIRKVEDRWNDELPEGVSRNVIVYYGQS